jgi:hypothetical protein
MESIDEQWDPEPSMNITYQLWPNITDAKISVKIWILDRGESWAPSNQSNKTRLQLHCLLSSSTFYIGVGKNKKDNSFRVTSYVPHNCPPLTHAHFKPRSSAWYIACRLEHDITLNRHIKPKEIQD